MSTSRKDADNAGDIASNCVAGRRVKRMWNNGRNVSFY
jgi:hypothetical protein